MANGSDSKENLTNLQATAWLIRLPFNMLFYLLMFANLSLPIALIVLAFVAPPFIIPTLICFGAANSFLWLFKSTMQFIFAPFVKENKMLNILGSLIGLAIFLPLALLSGLGAMSLFGYAVGLPLSAAAMATLITAGTYTAIGVGALTTAGSAIVLAPIALGIVAAVAITTLAITAAVVVASLAITFAVVGGLFNGLSSIFSSSSSADSAYDYQKPSKPSSSTYTGLGRNYDFTPTTDDSYEYISDSDNSKSWFGFSSWFSSSSSKPADDTPRADRTFGLDR
ncbi:MAG: hypothetical protein AB7F64_00245 [Gammaproteobacteria bacterium]